MNQARTAIVMFSVIAATSNFSRVLGQQDATRQASSASGVLPTGRDGKPLNLDFETGTLKDWTATGDAFKGQPIKGDTVYPRRNDMKSEHAGEYWIGGYERAGDKPQGTLTSVAFKVTYPWASFLVGGGPHEGETCVELVRADTKQVCFRASGHESENLERVVVDVSPHVGKEVFIRIVDKHSGHWGHINFDDFKFHETKPQLPKRGLQSPAEVYQFAGLSPEDAAKAMTVPDGFKVTLFTGEPDIVQPIAMAIDDRGRVWVAEAYSYPNRVPDDQAKDRILIFEDKDGDGKFDERKVFYPPEPEKGSRKKGSEPEKGVGSLLPERPEGCFAQKTPDPFFPPLNLVSGLELGFGGVWVGAAPYLMFIPDKDGDDVPDGEPEILLDGWGYQDTHETLNAFTWGPDGWLYGCHGVFTHSRVGKPGTPDAERVPLNAGIWRYHPTRHVFEVFAHGTSNPWGVDFNDYGQCFLTACVIPHLFHMIQGARYERQGGQHFNPYTYDDIKTIADHRHYVGNQWRDADRAKSDDQGGGHAHAGAMIYLGGTWPEKYRGAIFMNNIHGARINMDTFTPSGSGYVGSHGPDFIKTNDLWSQIINLQYGPDGNVYMIDWYDKNQCHRVERDVHDRTNGRIFKVSYVGGELRAEGGEPEKVDLKKLSDAELVELQLHPNDWYVRHARRILQERAAAGRLAHGTREPLKRIAFNHADATRRLRGLWALHVTGGLSEDMAIKGLDNDKTPVRAWTIQLALEQGTESTDVFRKLTSMAWKDPSPVVRLYLASGVQRLPRNLRSDVFDALNVVDGLVQHAEDANDHNLPLMYWYAAQPLVERDSGMGFFVALGRCKIPLLWSFTARRMAEGVSPTSLASVIGLVNEPVGEGFDQQAVVRVVIPAVYEALKGRRQVPMPPNWPQAAKKLLSSEDAELRSLATRLGVIFGQLAALETLRKQLADMKADVDQRREAMQSLLAARAPGLAVTLHKLLAEPALRRDALRGLAACDDAKTADVILGVYPALSLEEKRDALNTLAARVGMARALVAAVAAKKIPTTDLSADVLRQLRNLKDEELGKDIAGVWGSLRDTAEDKVREIRRVRGMLAARQAGPDELPQGRAVFAKTCQQCHTLFGTGAKIGPDLTGSNRADLEYLLSNVLDPSAVLAKEYQLNLIATTDGRIITGLVLKDDGKVMTVATANDTITLPHSDIDEMKLSDKSMMPDDLLKPLADDEVRALVAYLASPTQVPVLATADNVKSFFNGVDLAGWDGDPELWSVERGEDGSGEIVGKTATGIKHNEFLRSHLLAEDFKLTLKVKLTPESANSGIQFRSEAIASGEMRGPQADIGAGWWGKLYEENGRGLLWDKSGEAHVKPGEWNEYEVIAVGSRIRTFINGQPCVDLDDSAISRRGVIALQIHSGGPTEVRFRDLKLEFNPR